MALPDGIRADERVLFLGIPAPEVIREWAARLERGLIVVLAEDIHEARRVHAALENVMFVPGTAEEIPWQDAFFTRVIDTEGPRGDRAAREIARVTSPSAGR